MVKLKLNALPDMHPCLLWNDIIAATAAVIESLASIHPSCVATEFQEIPDYGTETVVIEIVTAGVRPDDIAKVRRSYQDDRLVELAAIAIAGLSLFFSGGHQIRDISLRGTAADYLVDDEQYLLGDCWTESQGRFSIGLEATLGTSR
jgi:hypothetical protein